MAKRTSSNPVDKAVASMTQYGRKAVGNSMPKDAVAATARDTGRQKLAPRKNSKSDAPDNAGSATHRQGVPQERLGPRFSIGVALPGPVAEEARNTQANGRIVRSVIGSNPNFDDQRRLYGSR